MFHQIKNTIREQGIHISCKPTFVSIVFIKGVNMGSPCVVTNRLPSCILNNKGTVGAITFNGKLQPSLNNQLLFTKGPC